jgi:N-acyl-phosphatidylethanolamine-hydrolysing phospholipase D
MKSNTEIKALNDHRHHIKKGFQNLYTHENHKSFFKFMKMRWREEWINPNLEAHLIPTQKIDLNLIRQYDQTNNKTQITWIGHSTFFIQSHGLNLITDPVFSERASPSQWIGPKRYTKPACEIEDLPALDLIVISHNHYDHMDVLSLKRLLKTSPKAKWFIPLENERPLLDLGVPREQIKILDWWDTVDLGTVQLTATPAQHWSARGAFDHFRSLWCSWVIAFKDQVDPNQPLKKIFFAGDTGYNPHQFKQIGDAFSSIDLALLPIGAYEPRWFMQYMHANPLDAVHIHQDLKSKFSIGMHWGTFPLTAESVMAPARQLEEAKSSEGIDENAFITMAIGQTISVRI